MPLYEYECPECGRFERIQKFSDPILTACPTCGNDVEKLLSAPAIQFKGTGWYVTDYAGKGKGGGNGKGEKAAKSDSSESKTSDAASKKSTSSSDGAKSSSGTSTSK